MRHRVLDASVPGELSAWLALWERWPGREVFAHPEYVRLFARPGDRAVCAVEEYEHTMRRRGASDWYFFPRSFFDDLVRGLAGQFVFFHALHAGQVVSSELILLSREHAYMLLSGTRAEAYPLRPNDLLRHRTVAWGAEQGLRAYVLGGGYEPGDGVFRHKRNFAPKGQLPFRVACLVHDASAARELEARRATAPGWTPRQGYFPRYRG